MNAIAHPAAELITSKFVAELADAFERLTTSPRRWIPVEADSFDLARACLAAKLLGFEEHLASSLHGSGFSTEIDVEVVRYLASDLETLAGVHDPQRSRCYFCRRQKPAGTVCECIEGYLPRRLVDDAGLAKANPTEPAMTYICSGCGTFSATTVGEVKKVLARTGRFRPRHFCSACFEARGRKAPRPQKPNDAARVAAELVSASNTAGTTGQA